MLLDRYAVLLFLILFPLQHILKRKLFYWLPLNFYPFLRIYTGVYGFAKLTICHSDKRNSRQALSWTAG